MRAVDLLLRGGQGAEVVALVDARAQHGGLFRERLQYRVADEDELGKVPVDARGLLERAAQVDDVVQLQEPAHESERPKHLAFAAAVVIKNYY